MSTQIVHIKSPNWPEFRFEWHETAKNVFLIRSSAPTHGEMIAMNIETEGGAHNAVLVWLRGYRAGRSDVDESSRLLKRAV